MTVFFGIMGFLILLNLALLLFSIQMANRN
ncbi:hypothetical protein SAMN06265375_102314 [Muriicola jejuensis]|nr:hypothetical protein SAMN06265375_102314 [Muriicola jejuensis]